MSSQNYIFFWSHKKANDEHHKYVFSQWYSKSFLGKINAVYNTDDVIGNFKNYYQNKEFSCREKFMMAMKALLFANGEYETDNLKIFNEIMENKNPSKIKNLGRKVKGFDENKWKDWRYKFVVNGNYLQFSQDESLKKILLNTKDKILVEASPYDRIWGIGFKENNALINKEKWGLNLLGKALIEVRNLLK